MIAALLAFALTLPLPPADRCDRADLRAGSADGTRGTTRRLSHHDDDRTGRRELQIVTRGRCVEVSTEGRVTFAEDDRSVTSVSRGGHVSVRERLSDGDRAVRFTSDDGRLVARARRDGREVAWDDEMRAWLAGILPTLLSEMSIEVPRRVARLHDASGVRGVLDLVERLSSSGARVAHYEALLTRRLSGGDLETVTRHATRHVASSGDLSSLVRRLPADRMRDPGGRAAIADAVERIASSGDRTETIRHHVLGADRDLLLALARVARGIPSSGDKADLLRESVGRYVGVRDGALRDAWFEVAATIPSSGDLAEVLKAAVRRSREDPDAVRRIIDVASHRVASSGDRSDVLLAVIGERLLTTPALRQAMREAARTIPSSGDYRRVMDALMAAEG